MPYHLICLCLEFGLGFCMSHFTWLYFRLCDPHFTIKKFWGFLLSFFYIFFRVLWISFHLLFFIKKTCEFLFFLNHKLSSSNNKEKLLDEIEVEDWIPIQVAIAYINTWEYFAPMELEEKGKQLVKPSINVKDIMVTMWTMVSLFKTFINFLLEEFEKLVQLVVQIIINHASSIREWYHIFKQPSKLSLEQHLLNFILYIKHDNVTKYDVFLWLLELKKKCNKWWQHFYCILHQFFHNLLPRSNFP